jgi:hypothetical protein
MKIKNIIFAIPAALAAIPPKPNIAAIIATTKKINANRNIISSFKNYRKPQSTVFVNLTLT